MNYNINILLNKIIQKSEKIYYKLIFDAFNMLA